jgi:hypothetical protein
MMELKDWLFLGVGIGSLALLYTQNKIISRQQGNMKKYDPAPNGPKWKSILLVRWPLLAMALLCVISWIPYFLIAQTPVDYYLSWAPATNGGAAIMVDTSKLVGRQGRRLMAVSIVIDPTQDEMNDTRIAKSRTYEITPPIMELDTNPTPEFLAREREGGNVQTYLLDVPRDFPLERLTKLDDVAALGGKIIEHRGYVSKFTAPTPSPQTAH